MKTIVIVQCRLSSTRLPRKALYELDGKPLLQWALESMKNVRADDFFVACDFDSEEDGAVTVRDRDTMEQERIKIDDLKAYFEKKFEW